MFIATLKNIFPIYKIYNPIFLASKKCKFKTLLYENVFVNVFFWSYNYKQLLIQHVHVIPSLNKTLYTTFQQIVFYHEIQLLRSRQYQCFLFQNFVFTFYTIFTFISRPFLSCLISRLTFLLMKRFIVENKILWGKIIGCWYLFHGF